MLRHTSVNAAACAAAASDSALLATDLADYLVKQGIPFRQAHHAVGELVASAEKMGWTFAEATAMGGKFAGVEFSISAAEVFDLGKAMARRNLTGAPGTKEVAKQLARWKKSLK